MTMGEEPIIVCLDDMAQRHTFNRWERETFEVSHFHREQPSYKKRQVTLLWTPKALSNGSPDVKALIELLESIFDPEF